MPLNSLVLKVASRCNLNCSYCYMYNLGDKTYKNQPKIMDNSIVSAVIQRTKEYIEFHNLDYFQFIFHGGEPLLANKEWYTNFVHEAKRNIPDKKLQFSLQTNGVLYNEEWASHLKDLDIYVGFSWDGPAAIHDKFRVYHNGRGSYQDVVKGVQVHRSTVGKVGGLSVLNAEIEPIEYYKNIKSIGFSSCSFILPHLHHSMKDEFNKFSYRTEDITYGKWLCELFDIWWDDDDELKPQMNFFNDFVYLLIGESVTNEAIGSGENNVLVIETNGEIESSSSLKSCGDGFTKEGNNVKNSKFNDVLKSDLVDLFINSHINLCEQCNQCEIKTICGGGRINQRYSESNGFDNPSIYCNDIKLIVSHIQNQIYSNLSNEDLDELNLKLLKYGEF